MTPIDSAPALRRIAPHRPAFPLGVASAFVIAAAAAVPASARAQIVMSAADIPVVVYGEGEGDAFGHRALGVGDVDGDDIPDLAVAARFNDAGGVDAGRIYLYSGATFERFAVFTGEGPGDELGHRIVNAGDLDGDGRADIVAGAYVNDAGGEDAGRVYFVSGRTLRPFGLLTGEAAGDELGYRLEEAGDADGDGRPDIVLSAWLHDEPAFNAGKVYLVSGRSRSVIRTYPGFQAGEAAGARLTTVDDGDGDGWRGVVDAATTHDGPAGIDSGVVRVRSGRTGRIRREWFGTRPGEQFGAPLQTLGDIDGDGVSDLGIAANRFLAGPGRVEIRSTRSGRLLHEFQGRNANDGYGERMRDVGDIDGDEVPDVAIAAPRDLVAGLAAGRVEVRSGADGRIIHEWTGTGAADRFGRVLVAPGDLNGDEIPEIVVGISGDDEAGTDAGKLVIHDGATGLTLLVITGERPGDWFGYSCRLLGDVDGDGRNDLAIGAIYAADEDENGSVGRAYVLRSSDLPFD